ncbi:MAG TPA: phosphotransferase [Myxococcota bacterium]|nr:phosphotransferase [Myxococcota bacterium]HRY95876.1 phosphotransferase [Myxococcota bacterium]HSA22109.1 phosphotransferase [Myxococcota bacterium]
MARPENPDPLAALAPWALSPRAAAPIVAGHINLTFRVEADQGRFALQWVNPIFRPEVNQDIEALTTHLAGQGLVTPRLVRTRAGGLWAPGPDGGVWRVMTWIEGDLLLEADSPARAAAAGELLGRFHAALWEHPHRFLHTRPGVHDTPGHLAHLRAALAAGRGHRLLDQAAPLGEAILAAAGRCPLPAALPARIVHGDPKLSNVVFGPDGRALAWIDLDTLARMPLALELGDAFRSWCSPRGEEVEAAFAPEFFEAGLAGWARAVGARPTPAEREAIPGAVELIALELAARFCADALEESYFGWDRGRYPGAGEHNLARARAQLALARSVRAQLADLHRAAARLLA